ncbi:hypothetical protein JXA40_01595 [bacterium]|nr:hypothetical protein [candidate division CSSED10-310 bacterium]
MDEQWKNFQIGAEVDVADIMKRIREAIETKQRQGIYTEEGIAELAEARIMEYAEEAEIDSALLERLRSPDHSWNLNPGYIISSHRTGLKARVIIAAKKMVRPFVRLYTDQIVGRQAQINLYFAHLIHNLVREMTRLQIQLTTLTNRADRIEREKEFLEKRLKTLEKMVLPGHTFGDSDPAE